MKIKVTETGKGDKGELSVENKTYLDLNQYSGVRVRIEQGLLYDGGWINFDRDNSGFIVGIELCEDHSPEGQLWTSLQGSDPRKGGG